MRTTGVIMSGVLALLMTSGYALAMITLVPEDVALIQQAIDESEPGDTVIIREGVYEERLNYNGRDVVVASRLLLGADPGVISTTVIVGDGSDGSLVTFASNESNTATLMGVTLRGGHAATGAGINISRASPSLIDVVIDSCEAQYVQQAGGGMGGGIYAAGGAPFLWRIKITHCRASYGAGLVLRDGNMNLTEVTVDSCESVGIDRSPARSGGVMLLNGEFLIENCAVTNNISHGGGAGIYMAQARATVTGSIFSGNQAVDASGIGGGVSLQNGTVARMERCLIVDNTASTSGGGITMYLARVDLVNCTIYGNTAGTFGGAIYQLEDCHVAVVNTIINRNGDSRMINFSGNRPNTFTAAYSCIEDGQESIAVNNAGQVNWLDSNIVDDPLMPGADEGNYELIVESPCRNAGTVFFEYAGRTLVSIEEGDYYGTAPDIGRFEFFEEEESVDPAPYIAPTTPVLVSCFPNPFNSSATISYDMNTPGFLQLDLFDLQGRRTQQLVSGRFEAGSHLVSLDAAGLPAGAYIIQARHAKGVEGRRIVVEK